MHFSGMEGLLVSFSKESCDECVLTTISQFHYCNMFALNAIFPGTEISFLIQVKENSEVVGKGRAESCAQR